MFLTLKTFDDVLGALGRAGGHLSGRLPDERLIEVVSLDTGDIDPEIAVEVREEVTPIREASPEEQLRRITGAGPLG